MLIFNKNAWIYGIATLKCPRCHEGKLFKTKTISFKKPFDMHDKCPHCEQRYVLETGFYYGAMFVSYILTSFLMFGMFGIFKFVLDMGVEISFAIAGVVIFSLFVWIFRVSRAIWLSMFVKFREKYRIK